MLPDHGVISILPPAAQDDQLYSELRVGMNTNFIKIPHYSTTKHKTDNLLTY